MRSFCFEVWTGLWSWNFGLFIVYCFSLNFIYYASCEIISKWNVGPAAIASIIFLRELSQLSQVIDSSFSYYFQLFSSFWLLLFLVFLLAGSIISELCFHSHQVLLILMTFMFFVSFFLWRKKHPGLWWMALNLDLVS